MNMVFRRVFLISVRCCCSFSYKVRRLSNDLSIVPILFCSTILVLEIIIFLKVLKFIAGMEVEALKAFNLELNLISEN